MVSSCYPVFAGKNPERGVEFLKSQGYEFAFGPFEAPSSIVAVMANPCNPSAHRYVVSHHKKD